MNVLKRISSVYSSAKEIHIDKDDRIVLMSDCHRGDGSWADDFLRNQILYTAAMTYYYDQGFMYIELGDGDELWENKNMELIVQMHRDTFLLLSLFHEQKRLYLIYGNHDIVKAQKGFVSKYLSKYYDDTQKKSVPLLKNIKIHEGIILKYKNSGQRILLIHGHQADRFNSKYWRISRFLVRYFWRPLEVFGVNDPTRAAANNVLKESLHTKLEEWVIKERCMMIAGHTHKPSFPRVGAVPYFNDGSCVHPYGITAIEIQKGTLSLIKWESKTREDGTVYIGRELLAGPERIEDYFKIWS